MKKILLFSLFTSLAQAQFVGVNTAEPKVTLDVLGNPSNTSLADGMRAPQLSLAQLNAKTAYTATQTGAMVYVTDITGGSTVPATSLVSNLGYHYFDGSKWQPMAAKSGSVLFTASLGTGAGGTTNATITAGAFNTVPLPNVTKNIGGGTWNATNNIYTVPVTGTYIIKSSVRLKDDSPSRNVYQAVHTGNADIPDGLWQTNSGYRWTMLYNRIASFNAGDQLRLFINSDGAVANISDASLNIVLVGTN